MLIFPLTSAPGVKGVLSDTPNHVLNCETSVSARQTRERGASKVTCFSMRSVEDAEEVVDMVILTWGLKGRYRDGAAARRAARCAYPRGVRRRGASRRRARGGADRCGRSGCARARCALRARLARESGCASTP